MKVFQKTRRIFSSRRVKRNDILKRLSLFNRIVFTVNFIFAMVLLMACMVPYVEADRFPYISILSLGIPILVGLNLLFAFYWALIRRKQFFLSFPILVLGYFFLGSFVKVGFHDQQIEEGDLRVMTFNVRAFNRAGYIDRPDVQQETFRFIAKEAPDIICYQETGVRKQAEFDRYPYRYVNYENHRKRTVLGIFSKYPIVDSGTFNWSDSRNNGSFADIVYKKDTIRVYNLHLESFGVTGSRRNIAEQPSLRLYQRLTRTFKKQSEEAKLFLEHRNATSYKTIVCGDFNNTQFSHAYRLIKGDRMQDTFEEKGSGLGRTYNFLHFPFRIDFILADPAFEVRAHKNYNVHLSDHFPVMASFRLQEQ